MNECINMIMPHECKSITEVRREIDKIDKQIIQLLSDRFKYVREVVKYKDNSTSGIEAPDRRKEVIETRRHWASINGLNPNVIEKIYNNLIDYFIDEEKKLMNE